MTTGSVVPGSMTLVSFVFVSVILDTFCPPARWALFGERTELNVLELKMFFQSIESAFVQFENFCYFLSVLELCSKAMVG